MDGVSEIESSQRKRKLETLDPEQEVPYSIREAWTKRAEAAGFNVFCGGEVGTLPLTPSGTLMGKVGLHSYNSHKGTNLQFKSITKLRGVVVSKMSYYVTVEAMDPENNSPVTIETCLWHASPKNKEALRIITISCWVEGSKEDISFWDPNRVPVLYTGLMPKWLDDGAREKHLKYYEVKESELQENEWLQVYAQVAAYAKWGEGMVAYCPLKIEKLVVQTMEDVEQSLNKFKSCNAIFYVSFKTCGGLNCRGIIRQTSDGRPPHMCLEVDCEIHE